MDPQIGRGARAEPPGEPGTGAAGVLGGGGEEEDLRGRHAVVEDERGGAGGEHEGLPAASSGVDEEVLVYVCGDGRKLFGVQTLGMRRSWMSGEPPRNCKAIHTKINIESIITDAEYSKINLKN